MSLPSPSRSTASASPRAASKIRGSSRASAATPTTSTCPGRPTRCVVRSPHAHANIFGIDTAAAKAAPGVLAVLTGDDLASDGLGNLPTDSTRKRPRRIPCSGHPAAGPRARPREARRRPGGHGHRGDAEPGRRRGGAGAGRLRAPALGGGDAGRACAPAPRRCGTARRTTSRSCGKRETATRSTRGFAGAAHVTWLEFEVTRVAAAPLEPRGAVGDYDRRTGRYALYTGTQHPHGLRTLLSEQIFKVPQSHMHVVTAEVGGSFGMKSGVYPEVVLVLWAARRLGPAGEVDVRPPRGVRHRRARARQPLDGRAGAGRRREVPGVPRGDQPEHRRVSHAAKRRARHQQRRRPGRRVHDAGDPRADHRRASATPRRRDRTAARAVPRRPTPSSASSTSRRASSGSTPSSSGGAT